MAQTRWILEAAFLPTLQVSALKFSGLTQYRQFWDNFRSGVELVSTSATSEVPGRHWWFIMIYLFILFNPFLFVYLCLISFPFTSLWGPFVSFCEQEFPVFSSGQHKGGQRCTVWLVFTSSLASHHDPQRRLVWGTERSSGCQGCLQRLAADSSSGHHDFALIKAFIFWRWIGSYPAGVLRNKYWHIVAPTLPT